jgi:tetratricopeptide (TPR) repeat protein
LSQTTSLSWQDALAAAQQSLATNDLANAYSLFQQLAEKLPTHGEIQFGYAQVLLRIEQFDEAIQQFQLACRLLPARADCLFALADAFDKVDAQEDVKTVMDFIAQSFASDPEVLYKLAHYSREIGDTQRAHDFAQACIDLSDIPLLKAYAWQLLLSLPMELPLEHCEQEIKQLLNDAARTTEAGKEKQELKMLAHYALGRVYELMNMPKEAFSAWQSANQIQSQFCEFTCDDMLPFFQALQTLESSPAQNPKTLDFTPIFILGLPRTGSTLLEQLLSQHPLITSIGEQALLSQQAAGYLAKETNSSYPNLLDKITSEQATEAAIIYQNAVLRRQRNSPFVIDKLPANFQSIDLIFALFPAAKVIDMRRNTAAVALSVFQNFFAEHEPYFCDLQFFSQYEHCYIECMTHFKQRYAGKILDVHYEELVRHPTSALAKVFRFCNIQTAVSEREIERMCDVSLKTSTRVQTLSATQVKQGISATSIDKYATYLAFMQEAGLAVQDS